MQLKTNSLQRSHTNCTENVIPYYGRYAERKVKLLEVVIMVIYLAKVEVSRRTGISMMEIVVRYIVDYIAEQFTGPKAAENIVRQ